MYANLNSDTWTEDSIGLCEGGDVGGDLQASDSYERRFAIMLDNGEFAVLSFTGYWAFDELPPVGVDYNQNKLPRNITVQVHYSHCTDLEDVGSSEGYADVRYWDHQEQDEDDTPRNRIERLTQEDLSEAVNQMAI